MTLITPEQCRVVEAPWCVGESAIGGRPCLLTPELVTEVTADVSSDALPRLAPHVGEDGRRWHCFELPSTSLAAGGPVAERLDLQLMGRNGRVGWTQVLV